MNFKRYHVSKNLLPLSDKAFTITAYGSNLTVTCSGGNLYFLGIVGEIPSSYTAWKTNFAFELEAGTYYCNNPSPLGSGFGRYIRKYSDDTVILAPSDYTFTLSETTKCYLAFYIYDKNLDTQVKLMLNTGSTALPYEPYSSEVWHDTPHYIHNTSTDTITTLPAVIYPNATTAMVGLKGNTVQNGTPTPTTPIQPQGTGVRTGNWFDGTTSATNQRISIQNGGTYPSNGYSVTQYIEIKPSTRYTHNRSYECYYALYDENKSFLYGSGIRGGGGTSGSYANAKYLRIDCLTSDISTFMVVEGTTLPSEFEPYGYKIPISSASTTTPVYLGEVESTRRIKKLVLTGEENVSVTSTGIVVIVLSTPPVVGKECICSHYIGTNVTSYSAIGEGECTTSIVASGGGNRLVINDVSLSTADAYKAFFAQQYTAGTPVCVWYVLATEETAIVNEPLMKIGTYADSISGISIPTTAGANTLDVDTTVKPSEATAAFNGWHPVSSAHERSGGAWT